MSDNIGYFSITFIAAAIIGLFGGWCVILQTLIILIVVDYITGLAGALYFHRVNSKIGFKGILKKVCILFTVVMAAQFDKILNQNNFCRQVVCLFYISNEGISIIENLAAIGVPVPKYLKRLLLKMHDDNDNGKGD